MERIAEIIPRVIVPDSPNGLPIAYTRCPTISPVLVSASVAGTRLGASIFSSARSCPLSTVTTVALYLCLSESVTSMLPPRCVPSITWLLVRISPSLFSTKPEPCPVCGTGP